MSSPVRVFISYSHDSSAHRERVLAFADRLRDEGVDAHIDAYEEAPPLGWPAWMAEQVREARFVLVVCTPTYNRRLMGREDDGVGLGARWEGTLITQAIYDQGGRNEKFVPVFFEPSDRASIPEFLQATTWYDLSTEDGYERLYRRLTQQPRIVKRPLGPPRQLDTPARVAVEEADTPEPRMPRPDERSAPQAAPPSEAGDDELILLAEQLSAPSFLSALSVEAGGKVVVTARPTSGEQRILLESLPQSRSRSLYLAYGLTAVQGRLDEVKRRRERGADIFTISLTPGEWTQGSGFTEMGTSNYSIDDIAELRARRILLDEALPGGLGPGRRGGDQTLEMLVAGFQSQESVARSPIPPLFESFGRHRSPQFLHAARLLAVLWLQATGTVEHILELDLRFEGSTALAVRFHGVRQKYYSNMEPAQIHIEGLCTLR